jgi:hypothetical protein
MMGLALAVVLQHCPAGQKADSVGIMDFFLLYNRLRRENFFQKSLKLELPAVLTTLLFFCAIVMRHP